MAVYQDIISWSKNKPSFMRDAIRRLLSAPILAAGDIAEIKDLVKKETGFDGIALESHPAREEDAPVASGANDYVRLHQISSPHNIAALYENTPLVFSPAGLSVVYGKNGSGKSSYSKILKKFCWSRDRHVELKKNVYTTIGGDQSVSIKYSKGTNQYQIDWREGEPIPSDVFNSVYVFDTKCANIYLNEDNPAEYKPAGLDVLERLIVLYNKLSDSFDADIAQLQKIKPQLANKYQDTDVYKWYAALENQSRGAVDSYLLYTDEQKQRRDTLEQALKDENQSAQNKALTFKKGRYQNLLSTLERIEKMFSQESLAQVRDKKAKVTACEQANAMASASFKTDAEFEIGGQAWKELWAAAREYAIHEGQTYFPIASNSTGEYCVFCHQPLTAEAKDRLLKFDLFVQDRTSVALARAKAELNNKVRLYEEIPDIIVSGEIKAELIDGRQDVEEQIDAFEEQITKAMEKVLKYISDEEIYINDIEILPLSEMVFKEITEIEKRIRANNEILANRDRMTKEFLKLDALKYLVEKKADIMGYYDENVIRKKYQNCKLALNTLAISRKIGEILDSQAITAQHALFVQYLRMLNPDIAAKVGLKKTKTSQGVTFQRCGFTSIRENLPEILSEGEQKIVAIANFLSECSIDGAKNTMVLDDPINSLDVDYRESIARIIIEMSKDRQVIVMTHDLYFLRLLLDKHKEICSADCFITSVNSDNHQSGIVSDEIPYLAKNVQERINTITSCLDTVHGLDLSQIDRKQSLLNDAKDKMRQLLERTVEEVLVNHTISRFSKNINFKKGNLAHIIVATKTDIDFLLGLYGKYSTIIHDGSVETIPNALSESEIRTDLRNYNNWKDEFKNRVRVWKQNNGYDTGS